MTLPAFSPLASAPFSPPLDPREAIVLAALRAARPGAVAGKNLLQLLKSKGKPVGGLSAVSKIIKRLRERFDFKIGHRSSVGYYLFEH